MILSFLELSSVLLWAHNSYKYVICENFIDNSPYSCYTEKIQKDRDRLRAERRNQWDETIKSSSIGNRATTSSRASEGWNSYDSFKSTSISKKASLLHLNPLTNTSCVWSKAACHQKNYPNQAGGGSMSVRIAYILQGECTVMYDKVAFHNYYFLTYQLQSTCLTEFPFPVLYLLWL